MSKVNDIHCACSAHKIGDTGIEIKLCQLHYYAPELREVLDLIVNSKFANGCIPSDLLRRAREAIVKSDYTL